MVPPEEAGVPRGEQPNGLLHRPGTGQKVVLEERTTPQREVGDPTAKGRAEPEPWRPRRRQEDDKTDRQREKTKGRKKGKTEIS